MSERIGPVVYNKGGHVAHITVKLPGNDSWKAMVTAGELAHKIGGEVYALYQDERTGSRKHIFTVEQGGLEIGRPVSLGSEAS